ncbi:hypothetical protein [Timonella sp. A28]|uniref:hypothetical protein n=1 Tax=Timonella sp. A28 TaxID=3442640 RepID=UPI003EBCB632
MIEQIIRECKKLISREVTRLPSFSRGVITGTTPLVVSFGALGSISGASTLVTGLRAGDSVLVLRLGTTAIILGVLSTPTWIDFQPAAGYEMHYDVQPQYMIDGGVLYMRGAIKPINGGSFGTSYVAITEPLTALSGAPRLSWHSVSTLAAGGNKIPLRAYIHETTLQIMVSAVSSTVHPAPDYVMLNGFSGIRID